ncbi:MAG: PHB depolymerase family esterase [Deltaproteobacteria bacterium]|nr:MAG: PHB depolymerase family esterase [Deltaproteobacteria bacterium]
MLAAMNRFPFLLVSLAVVIGACLPGDDALVSDSAVSFDTSDNATDDSGDPPTDSADTGVSVGWSRRTLAGMSTHVYQPSSEGVRGTGRGLLVVLHGCSQTGTDLKQHGRWVDAAEDHGLVVALPDVPNGGTLLGCWDYYGSSHSRGAGDAGAVIELAQTLASLSELDVDAHQIYVAGLSSGGGMAMVLGCLAPDVFAGVGLVAAPALGTRANQIGYVATSEAAAIDLCETLAAGQQASFATQVASVFGGEDDAIVDPGYPRLDAAVMAGVYHVAASGSFDVSALPGSGSAGQGQLWGDAATQRVSLIRATGMGHAWPAGGGDGDTYIAASNLDYAWYLGRFFAENNLRAFP